MNLTDGFNIGEEVFKITRGIKADLKLADYTMFVVFKQESVETSDAVAVTRTQEGELASRAWLANASHQLKFCFTLPPAGHCIYGFSPERMQYELLAYAFK